MSRFGQAYDAVQGMERNIEVIALNRRMAALTLSYVSVGSTSLNLMGAVGCLEFLRTVGTEYCR